MNIPVNARIELILKHFNLNQKQLAKQAGLPENTLSNAKKGKNIPNIEFFNSIYKALPTINPHWLYMGNGDMLADEATIANHPMREEGELLKKIDNMAREIDYLKEQIRDKEEIINLLKSNRVI
ncbi:helix-turn-helix domain-containing protein [uncultured Cytophaga sp.]|uniref:helix-turn-helix transcriptional regulator n=1 Tax=uncultured Cytophaga sp. TaxID=160238 RepID=UPI00260D21AE|nr:helix-turn-helix domain-containing protein [uncultured Cytophaga sp.]